MPRVTVTAPEKNAQPYRFPLDCQVVTLGRGIDNDIIIDCGSVSVHHAEMHRIKGGYELRDVGSTNGIQLEDEYHEVISLENGLNVKVGDAVFDFILTDEENEALVRETLPEKSISFSKPDTAVHQLPVLPVRTAASYQSSSKSSGSSFLGNLLLLIVVVAAFLAGLYVRHKNETGGSLIDAVQGKSAGLPLSAPPTSTP